MVRSLLAFLLAITFAINTGCEQSANAPGKPTEAVPSEAPISEPGDTTPAVPPETSSSTGAVDPPVTASETASTPVMTPKKPKREPIYEEVANGEQLIADALKVAQREHKNVLIEWGGNWCGWCYKLHEVFHKDQTVKPIVFEEYVLVLVDQGKNMDLLKQYGGAETQFAYPHLTILDSEGKILTNQETGSLETGDQKKRA